MKRLSMLAILIFSRMTFAEPTAADRAAPQVKPAEATAEAKVAEAKSPEAKAAVALVSRDLIQPLIAKESARSKFSRARMPPGERRVRILDQQPSTDAQGVAFVRFSVDARFGYLGDDEKHWRRDDITGCVYLEKNQIFVKNGDQYRPAAFLLGKNLKAAAQSTCQPAAAQVADSN